jgi:hypothetical protein
MFGLLHTCPYVALSGLRWRVARLTQGGGKLAALVCLALGYRIRAFQAK